jgi:hypothetical protein
MHSYNVTDLLPNIGQFRLTVLVLEYCIMYSDGSTFEL